MELDEERLQALTNPFQAAPAGTGAQSAQFVLEQGVRRCHDQDGPQRKRREDMAFAQGTLEVGQPTTVPVIRAVKQTVGTATAGILDAPPGTAYPMVETVRVADCCLLVTEPTPFGRSYLRLAVEVIRQLEVPYGVVLTRSDTGDEAVARYREKGAIPILMEIPFNRGLAIAYSRGVPWLKEGSSKGPINSINIARRMVRGTSNERLAPIQT